MSQDDLFQVFEVTKDILSEDRLVKPGMLIKRWLDIPGLGLFLFKIDSPLLSTAWSEKIAAELAIKIDLPTVRYELAIDEENNRGVISPDFMNIGETELEGSDLLNQIYGRGNYLYTLDESINSITSNNIQLPIRWNNPSEINNAVDLFVGYLLNDSWICNIDRHDENWGIRICADGRQELLPNFDCGISLGVKVSANDIEANRINVSRYSLIAKSMLFQQQGRSIDNVSFPDLTRQLLDRYPVATKYWSERIVAISSNTITELFNRIPNGWISETAKDFAIDLLEFNRQQIASICGLTIPQLPKIFNLLDLPEPPIDPEPPTSPAPKPPRPPNTPNTPGANLPESSALDPPADTQNSESTPTQSSPNTNMGIKLVSYDLLNRRPSTLVTSNTIKSEIIENTALEQLMRRQGILSGDEPPTFYVAKYNKYLNVDDLTNQAPAGTVLLATSAAQLYFGAPEVKAVIKTLMPLETQIPGYARGLFAPGQSQPLDRPLKVLVVNDRTGENNAGIPPKLIRNIVADGSSAIDRSVGEQMQLVEARGLPQVRGFSLDPNIGNYYIKGTVTPLNIKNYFASHNLDIDVDLVLSKSMLKGVNTDKAASKLGIYEVEPQNLFITRTNNIRQTNAKIGSVQQLYSTGLAKDAIVQSQIEIQRLQQRQVDVISLAEDYVQAYKNIQTQDRLKNKPETELPENVLFIEAILESRNWGLLELPNVRRNLEDYITSKVDDIKEGNLESMRGEYRPIIISGDLKHNQIAGVGLTTGERHVAVRFPVLNRGQVQAVEVNNDIPILQNPELGAVVPDAIYIGYQSLAEIQQDNPETYQSIITEFGSLKAAEASWRTNLEAMKADFDGDTVTIFSEAKYPNFYQEVVENLKPDKLMHFVSKDDKKLIPSDNLPEMVVERLKNYVGIINNNLGQINQLYASLDFIITAGEGNLNASEKREASQLKLDTLQTLFDSFTSYKKETKSLVEPEVILPIEVPVELIAAFKEMEPFYSVEFIKQQSDRTKINYLMSSRTQISSLLNAYQSKNSTLNATSTDFKQKVVLSAALLKSMEDIQYMRLKDIGNGVLDPKKLTKYLDEYATVYDELSKIIDLSQPIASTVKDINPDTNLRDLITTTEINIIPNYPYDANQIDRYLRDYQNIVLKKAIELVDKENQRSVDFVKSGVKPDEGRVYSVTHKLPTMELGIGKLQDIVVDENHQVRLAKSSNLMINALLVQLRPVSVAPEIKAVVDIFRSAFYDVNLAIKREEKELKQFKNGKPIVLSIETDNNDEVIVNKCSINGMKILREFEGKGSIAFGESAVFFISNTGTSCLLGEVTQSTKIFDGERKIAKFEFQLLYDRIDELKKEKREILSNFRDVIQSRGWEEKEVFAGIAQMVGEKSTSYNFLICALPETLREFILESGTQQIIVKTEQPELLAERTKYFVTSNDDGSRTLRAEIQQDGKKSWLSIGKLEAYGNQLLDGTTFYGTVKPNYNQVNIQCTLGGQSETVTVGKITNAGRDRIDRLDSINNIKIVKIESPNYQLNLGELKIPIIDIAPAIAARLATGVKTLEMKYLNVYGEAFSATTMIDNKIHYLSGQIKGGAASKKNWKELTTEAQLREERLESVDVQIDRLRYNNVSLHVYSGDTKIGEITQISELKSWGERFKGVEGNEINLSAKSVNIKQVNYQMVIEPETLNNQNLWLDVEPAKTYQTGQSKANKVETGEKIDKLAKIRIPANNNLQRKADHYCFPKSFSSRLVVPRIDENGFKEVEILQLLVPINKLDDVEIYLNNPKRNIKYTKLESGIPATYEESRRGYIVLQVDSETLTSDNKTNLSKALGKPIPEAKYQEKLESIPIMYERIAIKIHTLKKTLEQHPPSNLAPLLDLDKAKPVPYKLRPVTEEVLNRFKGKAVEIDGSIVFEFATGRKRDAAIHHLNLPISAELSSEDGKKNRYFAVVETGTLQTYINDRAVLSLSNPDRIDNNKNPIASVYAQVKQLSSLSSRSQMDIVMGFKANKYIGIPLTTKKNITQLFQDSWGENANKIGYNSEDIVMVTGNRSNLHTSSELLAQHFRTQYLPLIDAAVKAKATLLFGSDGGIDTMLRKHLTEIGYELTLNSAGVFEAKSSTPTTQSLNNKVDIRTTPSAKIIYADDESQSEEQSY